MVDAQLKVPPGPPPFASMGPGSFVGTAPGPRGGWGLMGIFLGFHHWEEMRGCKFHQINIM